MKSRFTTAMSLLLIVAACDTATDPDCCDIALTVDVPSSTGIVYLTGNLEELGPWTPNALAMQGEGMERTIEVHAEPGTKIEYKFTLGTWDREALDESGKVMDNYRLQVKKDRAVRHEIAAFKKDPLEYIADWQGSGVKGTLVYWTDVESEFLDWSRHVEIWLPPGYDDNPEKRYPVLYMHDGQNLFDPRMASTGTDWGVDEAIVRLSNAGVISPVIVVGAWNTADRNREYSPWHQAPDYARFLIEELKPRIDAEFRTLTGPEHTAAMGSSMGGLLSYYLVTYHPEVFGACGCISTHFPLSEAVAVAYLADPESTKKPDRTPYVLRDIAAGLTAPADTRYWFDYGGKGLDARYGKTHKAVSKWLIDQGKIENVDFVVREYPEADHSEASWRARIDDPLRFLYEINPDSP